uniref:anthranilate synthase n=1 Tax=Buchnera aphidicola TaxID=9 RepID=Q9ZES1_9GAMM|nr:aminodeoxychorismate/anthranilate synthase component II [Buchnera aphidicola]CAA09994.1 anthranilate synthase small subunit [Buchnera aphidicola]
MSEILLIDNLDSFTYNLVDIFKKNKYKVFIFRNYISKKIIEKKIVNMKNPILVFSPGPGLPKNAGCMNSLIKTFESKIPIIGICLGFQAIIEIFGGSIIQSKKIYHGKISIINHDGLDIYKNIKNPLQVGRYHSFVCNKVPNNFIANSFCKKIVMSIKNKSKKIFGFQYHPESILTPYGDKILLNTISWIENKI